MKKLVKGLFTICYLSILILVSQTKVSKSQPVNLQGVVNQYTQVLTIDACKRVITINPNTQFTNNDWVLVYQVKGGVADSSNSATFGNLIAQNCAGCYEINQIQTITGNTVTLKYPLRNNFLVNGGNIQLVKVARHQNANISGPVTATAYNGSLGGIVAIWADTLNLSSSISANGAGYRGGNASQTNSNNFAHHTNYFFAPSQGLGGFKGESFGNVSTPLSTGRGKWLSGGGGGNGHNAGGAGGGNGGAGGTGGFPYNLSNPPPGVNAFGGIGINSQQYLLFGGGGGGGHQNDGSSTSGSRGGGVIILIGTVLNGNNQTISANGSNVIGIAGADGAGGAGAGGSIAMNFRTINNVTINANGGRGGDANNNFLLNQCVGPGGGGSGGVIRINSNATLTNVNRTVLGGQPGIVTNSNASCFNQPYGASSGQIGIQSTPGNFYSFSFNNPDSNYCVGDTMFVNPTYPANTAASWTGPNGFSTNTANLLIPFTTINQTGWYVVTITIPNCPSIVDSFYVNVQQELPLTINKTGGNCIGDTIILSVAGFNSYNWFGPNGFTNSGASITIVLSTNTIGTYNVIGNGAFCNGYDTIQINQTLSLLFPDTVTTCIGDTISIGINSSQASSINWIGPLGFSNTLINPELIIASNQQEGYYFINYSINNCLFTDSVFVLINQNTATINDSIIICEGEDLTYQLSNNFNNISWTGPNNFSSSNNPLFIGDISLNDEGVYTFNYRLGACVFFGTLNVIVNPKPSLLYSQIIDSINTPNSITLNYTGNVNASVIWNINFSIFTDRDIIYNFSPPQNLTIKLTVTDDDNGCSNDTSFAVNISLEKCFKIPNVFTPNNDGLNDKFEPLVCGTKFWEILIYNRWGQFMYKLSSENPTWDGYFKEQLCQNDVYFYIANVTFLDNSQEKHNGTITVIN